jgi:hypothetical protein
MLISDGGKLAITDCIFFLGLIFVIYKGSFGDLRSTGILRGIVWLLFTDVSGQLIGPSRPTRTLDP